MTSSKKIIPSAATIFLLTFLLSSGSLIIAGNDSSSSGRILALIQKLKADAEKQIVANHGQATFNLLKKKLSETYPLDQYPLPSDAHECLTLTLPSQDTGSDENLDLADQSGVYFMTGIEATMKGFPDGAKWCFANSAALSNLCALHLNNLAFTLNLEGDFETALTLLNYSKTLDPNDSSIYVNLAYSYLGLEKYDEAIQAYLMAIMLRPEIKQYHEMLLAAQSRKEIADALKKPIAGGKEGGKKSPDLNKALSMLEDNKQKERQEDLDQELSTIVSSQEQRPGRRKNPRIDPENRFASYALSPEFFDLSSGGLPFTDFCQMAAFLNGMGGMYEKGEPPDELSEDMKNVARKTGQYMSLLFKGYAMEAAKICGDSDLENDIWEGISKLADDMAKSQFGPKKPDKKKEKEKFKTFCFVTICISAGDKSTYKLSVSTGIIGGEWKYNSKTYNFGFKASVGPKIKGGFGPITGEAGAEAYFECDLDSGPVAGVKGSATVSGGGGVVGKTGVEAGGKFDIEKGNIKGDVSLKSDATITDSISKFKMGAKSKLAEFSLENIYEGQATKSPSPQKNIFK